MAVYTQIDNPELYMQCKLYTGTGSEQAITLDGDENMQPDLVWIKCRSNTENHVVHDSVRGATEVLHSDTTDGEYTVAQGLKSFGSDGFTLGTSNFVNQSSRTFVAWCWKGGTTSGIAGSADITPNAYSFNQTSGFSIVTYNGTDVNGNTVLHGLGAVPHFMIVKRRVSNGYDWIVYHKDDVAGLYLNSTEINNDSSSTNIWFHGQTPTSTQFHIGTDGRIGDNVSTGAFVAYCFAPKQGFSKCDKFIGNGSSDGTFVYTGFRPAWVMFKNASAGSSNWQIYDSKRNGYNGSNELFRANATDVGEVVDPIDILSNGFKQLNTAASNNVSGQTYVYMAFAEQPFVNSKGVPCNAR